MSYFSGGLRAFILLYFVFIFADLSNGLECKSEKFINLFAPKSCPAAFDSQDKSFCCEGENDMIYCCDFDEFAKTKGAEYVIPVISGIVVGILAGCFICCLCCPCCMLYKRRQRGTVYGRVQQPSTIVSVQNHPAPAMLPQQGNVSMPNVMPMPMPLPMPVPQTQSGTTSMQPQGYPVTADYPGQPNMPPPPYSAVTNEGYAKQAPYNPNFYNN